MKKLAFLLLLTILGGIFAYSYFQRTQREIIATVQSFFTAATAGESQAAEMLHPELENGDALLNALALPGLFQIFALSEPRLQSLSRASVPVILSLGDDGRHAVLLDVESTQDGWKIRSFPQFVTVSAAIVIETTASEVVFLSGEGQEIRLNKDFEQNAGNIHIDSEHAGFVVGLGGELVYFEPFAAVSVNKLLTVTERSLEGESTGFFELAQNSAFFRPQETGLAAVGREEFIVGMKDLTFYTKDGEVHAVLLPKEYLPESVRVILNTTGFGGLAHREVRLTADSAFVLQDKVAETSLQLAAGQRLSFTPEGDTISVTLPSGERRQFTNRLFIIPQGGRVRVESLRRGSPEFIPAYHGHMETKAVGGQLMLVNEVPMEAYLYSVVPSEMPVSFGLVPLQVQAVAARSYAVASIQRSGFRRYAAHVDDSTSSQVYNNVPEYPESTRAVNDTAGVILTYAGKVADTRFFSASSGITANFEEVWHDPQTGAFPGTPIPYLTSRAQLRNQALPDLSLEDGLRTFFERADWDSYDAPSPWFRWKVEMTGAELEAVISRYLPERWQAQPDFVLTQDGSEFVSREIPDHPLGRLRDLRIIRRGGAGNVMELEIVGENGTYRLIKEYTIRFTLRPVREGGSRDIVLRRHDGSALNNYIIMPTTFFVMDIDKDQAGRITNVRFQGGGNGHGVGMSQWGVKGLAQDGWSFSAILSHYYPGSVTKQAY